MDKKKIIKRVLVGAAGLFVLFVVTLGVHIYMVTKPIRDIKNSRQLSLGRIDFQQELDSLTMSRVQAAVLSLKGTYKCSFNTEARNVVYGYYLGEQDQATVFKAVKDLGDVKAVQFVATEENIAKGCPVIDKSSFTYQLGNMFEKMFS